MTALPPESGSDRPRFKAPPESGRSRKRGMVALGVVLLVAVVVIGMLIAQLA